MNVNKNKLHLRKIPAYISNDPNSIFHSTTFADLAGFAFLAFSLFWFFPRLMWALYACYPQLFA